MPDVVTTWTPIDVMTDFRDDAAFSIDPLTKKVQVIVEQPIVAGENLSQFIKFQMPRYYDAIDLTGMNINILYESPTGYIDINAAVNAEYNDEYIRFGWLVPYLACPKKGTLYFAVEFVGTNYTLKTVKSHTEVLDSISGNNAVPEPTEQTWYITLQQQVSETLASANSALANAQNILNALGAPNVAETAEDMENENLIYVYTGSETGYTYGDWYYYDTTNEEWIDGGVYASTALTTDPTVARQGQAADAAAVREKFIAKPTADPNGTSGQLLQSLGNGNTQWTDFGLPTDAQVTEVFGAWLDDHPEATTTVDFSITTKVFETVAAMIADTTLTAGDKVATCGYYASGDNGGANYVVSASHTGTFYITLSNGLYANRLEEGIRISADQIGIKHYATQALAEADAEGMESNHDIAQAALNEGFSIVFGAGFYAFSDYLQMYNSNSSIYGVKREDTNLCFPDSIGINFCTEQEFDYLEINALRIRSKGNCINITADVRNLINCKFDNLGFYSEDGSGFVAPPNNRGSRQGDTCVWSCYFGHINAFCANGAIAKNVTGLGNWFYFINQCGDTPKAFWNCTGTFMRFDTLTTAPEYAFYFDNAADYGMRITLIDFHYECVNLLKSFIYFTDEAAATSAIGIFAIDSGISNYTFTNHDIPFIKVGGLVCLMHFGKYTMLPEESGFDMSAVNGALIHISQTAAATINKFKTNLGGGEGLKVYAKYANKLYRFYQSNTSVNRQNRGNADYEIIEERHAATIDNISGGRELQTLTLTDNMLPDGAAKLLNIKNIDPSKLYCDCIVFKLTSDTTAVKIRNLQLFDVTPGRIITLINDSTSTKNVNLEAASGSTSYGFVSDNNIAIEPGNLVHLMLSYHFVNGTRFIRWFPFTPTYTPASS